ncbi:hypothetical protein C1646_713047 [Rhizophagus diaphanus]|nr:hypothetical protein C1646_713047 [Rhizophagus diaphanus] [Rhizophagus sp. MUCL 43196]
MVRIVFIKRNIIKRSIDKIWAYLEFHHQRRYYFGNYQFLFNFNFIKCTKFSQTEC